MPAGSRRSRCHRARTEIPICPVGPADCDESSRESVAYPRQPALRHGPPPSCNRPRRENVSRACDDSPGDAHGHRHGNSTRKCRPKRSGKNSRPHARHAGHKKSVRSANPRPPPPAARPPMPSPGELGPKFFQTHKTRAPLSHRLLALGDHGTMSGRRSLPITQGRPEHLHGVQTLRRSHFLELLGGHRVRNESAVSCSATAKGPPPVHSAKVRRAARQKRAPASARSRGESTPKLRRTVFVGGWSPWQSAPGT